MFRIAIAFPMVVRDDSGAQVSCCLIIGYLFTVGLSQLTLQTSSLTIVVFLCLMVLFRQTLLQLFSKTLLKGRLTHFLLINELCSW